MAHRLLVLLAVLIPLLAPAAFAADAKVSAGATPAASHRVVIQINEDDAKKWHAVLTNIRNIQADVGAANIRIAVVVISQGLGMLLADALTANGVQDAMATGVEFIACGNSMKAQKVGQADLVEGSHVAVAGYAELIRRQEQGWAYLRP